MAVRGPNRVKETINSRVIRIFPFIAILHCSLAAVSRLYHDWRMLNITLCCKKHKTTGGAGLIASLMGR
jgi:hypothetical protein